MSTEMQRGPEAPDPKNDSGPVPGYDLARIAEGVADSQRVEGFHPTPGMVQRAVDEVARSRTDGSYDRAVEAARVAVGHPAARPAATGVSDPSLTEVSAPTGYSREPL